MVEIKNSDDYGDISDELRRIHLEALRHRIPDGGLFGTLTRLADENPAFASWLFAWNRADADAKNSWTVLWHRIRKQAKAAKTKSQ